MHCLRLKGVNSKQICAKTSSVSEQYMCGTDNLWNDQALETDPHLPPGWRTIRDTSGTYYWHVPTGTTQWQHPGSSSEDPQDSDKMVCAMSPSLDPKAGGPVGSHVCREGKHRSSMPSSTSIDLREPLPWQHGSPHSSNHPDSKCFAVRSLGWVEIPEEDLTPGKSSIAVNNCIQQLSYSKYPNRDPGAAWGEVRRKDTPEPPDFTQINISHTLLTQCNGDFAYVASDKDTCMLKCHVFHCDTPAKAIATALHQMCSKIMAERAVMNLSPRSSETQDDISPEDLQVDVLEAIRQSVQTFHTLYVGHIPVSKPRGMELVNDVISSLLDSVERQEWEPVVMNVTDTTLTVCKGKGQERGVQPWWECRVRYLTFLGVGKDPHALALIEDTGHQRFQCHVFWCEPDAGYMSEAVQAACMLQYQKCLVSSAVPAKPKPVRPLPGCLKSHLPTRGENPASPCPPEYPNSKCNGSGVKRGVLSLIDTFRQKQSVLQML
uniref:Amyloid beta A4 protein-binding family B member 3 n=1 Tax=Callorhinchus milii TaxID=7868 RepID=A0A4W3K890_CALMI